MLVERLRDAAIFFLDADGRVCDWTPSAERLLGWSADAMLGQSLGRFAPLRVPAVAPAARSACPEPDATGLDALTLGIERATLLGQSETPGWQQRADGSLLWAQTVLTALHDPDSGELRGYACLMRDQTESKRLLELLEQLNASLEAKVLERTRQLQEINHDLEAFSASVSHDLRAPLRHISSYLELLREDLDSGDRAAAQQHLETLAAAAKQMGQLIDGLLAFSRLGRAALQGHALDMGDLLHASRNRVLHDPALQRAPNTLHWELAPDWPTVVGDALLLSQVWDNLLANALKYSRPRAQAHITVGWERASAETEWVFWVRDNGVGFDMQHAQGLFGVFQRLHRARDFEGVGMGLALCRRIVERHGGRIWAISAPDQGSTFYFSLPLLAAA